MRDSLVHGILADATMVFIARAYAISVLRNPGTWFVVLGAMLFAWVGIAFDLFAFDGSERRSIGVVVGSFEIAVVLLAIRARVTGIASAESEGFRSALVHRAGATPTELGCAIGSGGGALAACLPAMMILLVVYNLMGGVGWLGAVLLGLGLIAEAALAAAWAGFGAKLAGRVPAIAIAMGAFVVARLSVPHALGALLPAPLPLAISPLVPHVACAMLSTLGLALASAAIPDSGAEAA